MFVGSASCAVLYFSFGDSHPNRSDACTNTTSLIIIKCCSMSFILTLLPKYANNNDNRVTKRSILCSFCVADLFFFVHPLFVLRLHTWVRMAINWNNKLYWIIHGDASSVLWHRINCNFFFRRVSTARTFRQTFILDKKQITQITYRKPFRKWLQHKHAYFNWPKINTPMHFYFFFFFFFKMKLHRISSGMTMFKCWFAAGVYNARFQIDPQNSPTP